MDLIFDPETNPEKRLRELRLERYHRLKDQPHRYFVPTGKFEEFTNVSMSGIPTVSLLEAANGIGKTFGVINLLANLFWPAHNKYFQQELFRNWTFPKKGRIISYANTITETIIPLLKEIFPKGRYNVKYKTLKNGKRYEASWETDTGWRISLMTYDQAVTEFESATLGFFWEDEPPTPDIHAANLARLRLGGVGFITETPLTGSQWIFDDFIDKTDTQLTEEKKAVVQAELESACDVHGVRGFLTHQRILDIVAGYDEEDIDARVFGKHHHLTGIIFKKWNKAIHIIKPFTISYNDYVVIEALDPHPQVNDAVLWVAIDRSGRYFMVNELWGTFETAELAERIKVIEKNYRIIKRIIDPSAFVIDKHTGYQLAADLSTTYHLDFIPGSKERSTAIEKIREFLDFQQVENEIINPPRLRSFDTCERANWEIGRWKWQDWSRLVAQFKNPKEKPVDKDDHMIENLGRILLADIPFEEVITERQVYQSDRVTNNVGRLDPYA